MKKLFLSLAIICCIGSTHGGNVIRYTYDNAGNRTKRDVLYKTDAVDRKEGTDKIVARFIEHEIQVYPSLTKGILTIDVSNIDGYANGHISIFNLSGILIKKIEPIAENNTFDISSQPNGVYLLQIKIGDQIKTQKIIKE